MPQTIFSQIENKKVSFYQYETQFKVHIKWYRIHYIHLYHTNKGFQALGEHIGFELA